MASPFVRWLWASALVLTLAGCSTVSTQGGKVAGTNDSPVVSGPRLDSPDEIQKRIEAHTHFMVGLSRDANGEPNQAIEEFEKSLVLDPGHEELAVELSRRHLQRKEYEKAIAVLKRTAAEPDSSGLMFARLSLIYLQQGRTNDAVQASRDAIKREPSSSAGYQSLFHLQRALGQTNEARKTIELAARQPKPDAPFLIDLGQLYLALDADNTRLTNSPNRLKARDYFIRAAGMENTNLVARQKLAQGFMFIGETKRAADIYAKMVEENPDLGAMRESLAELYLRQNEPKLAAEQLKEIIRDSPTNPQAYYFLGAIAYEEKEFAEALEYYRKALLLGLNNEQIYFDLAGVSLALNQPRQALDYLAQARQKFRPSFVGEFYTGLAYMRLKEFTNALDHFTSAEIVAKATDTNRLTHGFYFELGSAFERAGKIPEAERYFERCLEMSPNFAGALNYLGYMWAERGTNLTRARAMIEQAVQLFPTNAAYLDSLGWVLFKQGYAQEALTPMLKAVELNDEPDATLYDHLGDIYSALHQTDKAREAWSRALKIEPNTEIEKKFKAGAPPPGASGK